MIYEPFGQDVIIDEGDNTTLRHAAREGVHDAVSDIVKFSVIGLIAIVVLKVAGEKRIKRYAGKAKSIL